jgi:capsular polysaccharide biosynthesis protein
MSSKVWRIEDPEPNPTPPGVVQGSWVSLHYLRSTLRRRWRLVAATATAGLLLALAAIFLLPASVTASATVLLAHDSSEDPLTAISTDDALLHTRTVSEAVVQRLNLPMTAEDFQSTFTSERASVQVLVIDLKAPTEREAVNRLAALCTEFLAFRNESLQGQAEGLANANNSQIENLRQRITELDRQYQTALKDGRTDDAQTIFAQRSGLQSQISSLQLTSQNATLEAQALATASHVVDAPALVPGGGKKAIALGMMSGLILGSAFGIGVVFVHALISNSLRRREEVATALGRPVPFSAGRVRGSTPWSRLLWSRRRRRNLDVLASGVLSALPEDRRKGERLGVLGVGDLRATATILVAAAQKLQRSGEQVFLVDLTEQGWLSRVRLGGLPLYTPDERTHVPAGALTLAAAAPGDVPEDHLQRNAAHEADVILVLGEAELGVGTGHLSTWTERVVMVVASGKATPELLRSVSRMLTRSGPTLEFAVLVGADRTDESLGVPRRATNDEQRRRAR